MHFQNAVSSAVSLSRESVMRLLRSALKVSCLCFVLYYSNGWICGSRTNFTDVHCCSKAGQSMPTQNRRDFVRNKARLLFDDAKRLTDASERREALILGLTHLESLQVQVRASERERASTSAFSQHVARLIRTHTRFPLLSLQSDHLNKCLESEPREKFTGLRERQRVRAVDATSATLRRK